MDREILRRLELLNQLRLTEEEKQTFLEFFNSKKSNLEALDNAVNTQNVERMVHVMPVMTVVREDVVKQPFSRDDLQRSAPETDEGYWCVPRVVE
ncbi:MAG: Asp-tRNA(Asn)/Glu-tRNA(Gln) amidotransferase subunit GatC [Clostridia bacterium]|nr:Asp-tRNA(Asn)/Glu-tRNA(Gln) amidotransferase subunit GatC [Clostridia bacterium]